MTFAVSFLVGTARSMREALLMTPRRRNRRVAFTARSIGHMAPETQPVDWFDASTPGLALRVTSGGARTWYAFYRKGQTSRRVKLGAWPALDLSKARTLDVTGAADASTWRYRCDLAGPSGTTTIVRPAEGVIHCRYSIDPARPWVGVGPLERARLSGRLSAELEAALGDEASGTRGFVLPIPSDGQDSSVADLRRDIGSLGGKTALVETAMAGWGDGRMAAPRGDYEPKRLGANPPASLATLRSDAAQAVLSACGTPIELMTAGDGTGQREAWRRFLHGTVQPLAACVAGELAVKLDTPTLTLSFDRLFASDLSGRARAFQSLVNGGMDVNHAAGLAGLLLDD